MLLCCRWSPKQALQHPFITQALFTGPFQPTPDSPLPARSMGAEYISSSTANSHPAAYMTPKARDTGLQPPPWPIQWPAHLRHEHRLTWLPWLL